eukprot:TRINITY_DN34616_c0_g1_i1.p1 TRINITY_DN34616_c0_g1~~TRINITY_DN34616_c0_g1_i1.p1  ORF type:complete len:1024 (+),score=204.76 TRINITY_DN34616_c0_g1_i1:73-3144(+)
MPLAPSAETNPYWCAYFVVLLSSVLIFSFTKKESDADRHAKKKKRELVQDGLRLVLAEVEKGDETDGEQREKGLPEASRVLSYLYDEISEQPTTYLGIPASHPDFVAAKKLLNRTLKLQVRKTLKFTRKAIEVQDLKTKEMSAGGIPPTPKRRTDKTCLLADELPPPPMLDLMRGKSWEVTPAERMFNDWLKDNDSSKKELNLYKSGEKLEEITKMGSRIKEVLGDGFLDADIKELMKECEVLVKVFHRKKRESASVILGLLREVAPRWIFALIIVQIHPLMWFEYDRIVSGKALYASIRKDGTWDQQMSFQKIIDVLVMCAVWHFTNGVGDIIVESAKRKFTTSLKARFCECLMFQDFEYFEINGVGALQSRLNQDVEEVSSSMLHLPYHFLRGVFGLLSSFIYVFYVVPWDLAAIAFIPLVIIAPINNQLQRFNRRRGERLRKMSEHAASGTMDALMNIDVVRGFATEKFEIWRYTQAVSIQAELASKTDMVTRIAGPLCAFLFTANLGFLSYFAAMKVANKEMLIEDCGVFLIQIGLHAQGRVMMILDLMPQILKMLNPLYRLVDHLNAQPKIEPHPNNPLTRPLHVTLATEKAFEEAVANLEDMNCDASVASKRYARTKVVFVADTGDRVEAGSRVVAYIARTGQEFPLFSAQDLRQDARIPVKLVFSQALMPKTFEGNIEFRNVRFTYPRDLRKPIYKGVSYFVKRGQKIGICGSTGCGKSTGFGLLQRFYDVDPGDGMILIDGVDIREYDVHYLRQRIAMVSQKCVLFKTTVKENILYGMNCFRDDAAGKEEAMKAVIAALKLAQAWNFINDTPDKLLTQISETGGGFSGGQKQRLCIARVLIRKPDVILLDEATSALDPESERAVQNTLDQVMKDYTVVAVAHRLTTIKDSDKIIVLNEGNVVEEGPHDELLKKEVVYSDEDGNRKVKAGFYRSQWEAQFKQKELTNDKLRSQIECLQHEISVHERKIERTRSLMATWRMHGWSLAKHRPDSFVSDVESGEDLDVLAPGSSVIPRE